MTEQRSEQQGSTGGSPLHTERGNTIIQDTVVSKIAGIAAGEVDGIRMGSGAAQTASSLLGSIPGVSGGSSQTQGDSVEVGQEGAGRGPAWTGEDGKVVPQGTES